VCGTSTTTVRVVPHTLLNPDGKLSWEVWTLGIAQELFPRQDRHFQLHNLEEGAQR